MVTKEQYKKLSKEEREKRKEYYRNWAMNKKSIWVSDINIILPRTKCFFNHLESRAITLHNGMPICKKCDDRLREHKGMEKLNETEYKTEEQILRDYSKWVDKQNKIK